MRGVRFNHYHSKQNLATATADDSTITITIPTVIRNVSFYSSAFPAYLFIYKNNGTALADLIMHESLIQNYEHAILKNLDFYLPVDTYRCRIQQNSGGNGNLALTLCLEQLDVNEQLEYQYPRQLRYTKGK